MNSRRTITAGLVVAALVCVASAGLAEEKKSKKELQDEAKRKAQEQQKQAEQLQKNQEVSKQILEQQQLILRQQQAMRDTIERTRIQAKLTLAHPDVAPDEAIPFELTIMNASQKAFMIDSRRETPNYEIRDEKGKVVSSSKGKSAPPEMKKGELVPFNPKDKLSFPKGEVAAPSKPGAYFLTGSYFFRTLQGKEGTPDIWFGSIHSAPVRFTVKEKKGS